MVTALSIQFPRWSKRVVTELGGRDPLGLSRVASLITDYLLTGITTQTSRARYYSYYPWSLWHIERSEQPQKYAQFNQAFRRREAFMALSTTWHNPNSSVVGSEAAGPKLANYKETREININFKVLPSNGMGGYGQYYGGSLYQLGLTTRTEAGIERCAPGTAVKLAEAYDAIVARTPFCKKGYFQESTFPLTILEKSAAPFSLDTIRERPAQRERDLLRDLFFAWTNPRSSTADTLRRHTLGLVLHVMSLYNHAGFRPSISDVDHYFVHYPYYYQVLWLDEEGPIPYQPPAQLETCFGFWKQFCVHQYLTLALEHLLAAVLEIAGNEPGGLQLEPICEALCDNHFRSTLKSVFGDCSRPYLLLKRVKTTEMPTASACSEAQEMFGATSKLSEQGLLDLGNGSPQVSAAVAAGILSVLFAKWRNSPSDFSRYINSNAGGNLCVGTVLPHLDGWLSPDLTWQGAFQHLVEPFILQQHDRVMYEKGKLESCWLHRVEGRIVKDQDYSPGFRASRHWSCVKIMSDLGLVEVNADGAISVTKDGRQTLSRVLKDHAR